jgi:hypothetical protein
MTHLLSREMAGVGTASRDSTAASPRRASVGAAPAEATHNPGGRPQLAASTRDNSATPRYGVPPLRPVPTGEPGDRDTYRDAANLDSWTREIRLSAPANGVDERPGQPARGRAQPGPNVPAPADGGTSGAGLPVRVPMAQLPNNPLAAPTSPPAPGTGSDESDPAEVKAALRRFYRGVHRANPDDTLA